MLTQKSSEQRIWSLSPDLLSFVNKEGRFIETNSAWQDVLGWNTEEIRSRTIFDFVHPDDSTRTLARFEMLKQGDYDLNFENRYLCKDGTYRWLSWASVQENELFFCSARDVTEHKEQLLALTTREDEELLCEQFIAILGHDLRNPLAAIGAAVRIATREQPNEKIAEMLSSIEGSVGRMAKLIDVTMDFAKARLGGGIPVCMQPTEGLAEGFEQVIDEIRLAYPDRKIDLSKSIDSPIAGDADRLNQMLSNLVGNAVTHGSINRPIHVKAKTADDIFELAVINFGRQIPESLLPDIFDPFSRGEEKESMQGLGLGLYISNQIAKAHGGKLTVLSDKEQTCFSFKMPIKPYQKERV